MNALARTTRGNVPLIDECPLDDFSGYVVPHYSKSQIVAAGKLISAKSPHVTDELVAAFRVAHDWRGAHVRPMRRVRIELRNAAAKVQGEPPVPARLKRMQSIRRKMQRRPMTLFQMQDIAGARAIMSTMEQVEGLIEFYQAGRSKFEVQRVWDYVGEPKRGGYRSHHLRLVCPSEDPDEAYAHLSVEVQLRTELQHMWATAVEAVGLVRGEELKGGLGDAKWLRFFEVTASEIAHEERRPVVPGVPEEQSVRIEELRELEAELDAIRTLDSYNLAIKKTEHISPYGNASLYMLQFDPEKTEVTVTSYRRFSPMYEEFFREERDRNANNTVTVEVDRIEDLRRAYPNYYLDVADFANRIRTALRIEPSPPVVEGVSGIRWKWGNRTFVFGPR